MAESPGQARFTTVLQFLVAAAALLHRMPGAGIIGTTGPRFYTSSRVGSIATVQALPVAWAVLSSCTALAAGSPEAPMPSEPTEKMSTMEATGRMLQQVETLRGQLAEALAEQEAAPVDPGTQSPVLIKVLQARLELAVALQQLHSVKPQGSKLLKEAEELYRTALEMMRVDKAAGGATITVGNNKTPVQAQTMGNLAALLMDQGRNPEALKLLDQALSFTAKANATVKVERNDTNSTEGAEEQLEEQEVILAPTDAMLCSWRGNRAMALTALGRLPEAKSAFIDTVLKAYLKDAACYAKTVTLMEHLPDDLLKQVVLLLDDAQEFLKKSAPRGKASATSAAAAAADAHMAGKQWLLGLGVRELSWLHSTVFRELDIRGHYEEGWKHIVRAQQLASSLLDDQSSLLDRHQLNIVTGVFRQPLLSELAQGEKTFEEDAAKAKQEDAKEGSANATATIRPIFLVGMPRTGAQLLEAMLSAHGAGVWGMGDVSFMAELVSQANTALGAGTCMPGDLRAMGRRYIQEAVNHARGGGFPEEKPLAHTVDKMGRNLFLVGHIDLMLPDSCIVHVQRHPLDVAVSAFSQPFGFQGMVWAVNMTAIVEQIQMANTLANHWAEQLPGRVLTVRYEELISAPEATMERVLTHCGMELDPEVFLFYNKVSNTHSPHAALVRRQLHRHSINRWRNYQKQLTKVAQALEKEVAAYEQALASSLKQVLAGVAPPQEPEQAGGKPAAPQAPAAARDEL